MGFPEVSSRILGIMGGKNGPGRNTTVDELVKVDRARVMANRSLSCGNPKVGSEAGLPQLDNAAAQASSLRDSADLAVRASSSASVSHHGSPDTGVSANHGASARMNSDTTDETDEDCVVCFERPATIVFKRCGHQAYCKTCRRKALKKAFPDWTDMDSYLKLLRRAIRCPLCREESPTTEIHKHKGTLFRLGQR